MSVSKRCPHPECHELIPVDASDCGTHKKCHTEGCKGEPVGNARYCPVCKKRRHRESCQRYKAIWRAAPPELRPHRPVLPEREHPPGVLTDEAQAALNRASDLAHSRRLAAHHAQMGLVSVPGRPLASEVVSLPREEIERLAAVYRPPERKGGMWLQPWMIDGV